MKEENKTSIKRETSWLAVLWYIHLHLFALYAVWLFLFEVKWFTIFFGVFITSIAILGETVGAHRLWAHNAIAATWQIKLFLIIAQTLAGVGSVHNWALNHRIHHKYFGTDNDPQDNRKGFLYSHVLNNFLDQQPYQEVLAKNINMRDLETDICVWIQRQFYWVLFLVIGLLLPINTPVEYWDETILNSIFVMGFLRLTITTNISWLMSSGILIWGLKPGEKYPVENSSAFFIHKSHWLNYHYLLPYDWKSGEFGKYENDISSLIIKFWHEFGLVNNLKTIATKDIRNMLYDIAIKKTSVNNAMKEIKELSERDAIMEDLRYRH